MKKIKLDEDDCESHYFHPDSGVRTNFDDYSKLNMGLEGDRGIELIKILNKIKLPELQGISILTAMREPIEVKKFLVGSIPNKINYFYLGGEDFPPRPALSEFLDYVNLNAENIKKEIWFRMFNVTKKDIQSIMKHFSHVEVIGFYECEFTGLDGKFELDEDLTMKLQRLSFEFPKSYLSSKSINSILTALHKTSAKETLTGINLTEVNQYDVHKVLVKTQELKWTNLSIENSNQWYFYNC